MVRSILIDGCFSKPEINMENTQIAELDFGKIFHQVHLKQKVKAHERLEEVQWKQ